jgi:heme/copper-type cytochrome/quinol oxidase subunit 1
MTNRWLALAVAALIGAGLLAALAAMSRTPGLQSLFPEGDYLRIALVGHVILAVAVWFLAFQAVLWSLAVKERGDSVLWRTGFRTAAVGTAAVMLAAFLGRGEPVLANYVPLLTHPLFIGGLLAFGIGIGLTAGATVAAVLRSPRPIHPMLFGAGITSGLVLLSFVCFGLAAVPLISASVSLPAPHAVESLMWGGGHVLQFANTAAMVLAWFMLAEVTLKRPVIQERWAKRLLALYGVAAAPAPFLYLTGFSRAGFTFLMAFGLGPITLIVMIVILREMWRHRVRLPWGDPRFAGLFLSVAVFGLGGLVALGIHESSVIIPAHYHGAIGGVTLAFMGFSYHLLTAAGREAWSARLARLQPYLYGIGQSLFVLGLFWAGARDVPRKTFGSAQMLQDLHQTAGMGLMGLGGLVAIFGGVAFILNLVPFLLRREHGSLARLPLPYEAPH